MKSRTLVALIVLASLLIVTLNIPISKSICFNDPKPDLKCEGDLFFDNVVPGSTVENTFMVKNIGDPGSNLDWVINVIPDWGDWTFDPESGNDLKPEDGPVTVTVTIIAPSERNKEFAGRVEVINIENYNDYDTVIVGLINKRHKQQIDSIFPQFLGRILQHFPLLAQLLSL